MLFLLEKSVSFTIEYKSYILASCLITFNCKKTNRMFHDRLYMIHNSLRENWILDVIGHSPWVFSGPIFRFLYWVRSDVSLYKAPQAAAISPFLISPTHPTHTWGDRPPHRELRPLLFSTSA